MQLFSPRNPDYVKAETRSVAIRHGGGRVPDHQEAGSRWVWRGLSRRRRRAPSGRPQGVPPIVSRRAFARRVDAARQAREAAAVPSGPQELLRGRALARADLALERRLGAQLLSRERNRLHGDELPAGRHPAGLHRHRARPEARQGVPRIHHPLAVRRDPARLAHRAPAQDAAPRHQAGQHLHHQRQQGGAARLRRGARGAEQGRQLHPPDVHARLRRTRDVPARRHAGPVDRHLRDRRVHLRLHAGISAQRRAAAHREGPPRAVALADGMGGHPEGEVASQLALQTLAALFQRDSKPTLADPLRFLHEAIIAGHHQLLRYATQKALIDTPRTTVVACVLQGNAAYWAHCGDSRLYMVRGDKLIARTRDHSYSELQETLSHVVPMGKRFNRNVLFTCLGSPGKPVVDTVGPLLLQAGDRLLLCSDGLWGSVSDASITAQLAKHPISDAVPELVEQALRNGGPKRDNVSVLAMEWESAEDSDAVTGISTQTLCGEVFASTIQASVMGQDVPDELDDAEIERSIKEINEAIRRSSQKKS